MFHLKTNFIYYTQYLLLAGNSSDFNLDLFTKVKLIYGLKLTDILLIFYKV